MFPDIDIRDVRVWPALEIRRVPVVGAFPLLDQTWHVFEMRWYVRDRLMVQLIQAGAQCCISTHGPPVYLYHSAAAMQN